MPSLPLRSRLPLVALLLFGSGLSSLVYQVAWMRELRLVFGFSTAASAAVVAIFLGGLGIGSRVLGRRADRQRQPLAFYGKLELGIALSAAVTPFLLMLIRSIYVALGGSLALGALLGTAVRLLLSGLVLLVPTFLMGGTLSAASRAVETDEDSNRRRMAILYGANTLGAVVGTALSTFWLLEQVGTRATLWAACAFNVVIALAAIALGRGLVIATAGPRGGEADEEAPSARREKPPAPRWFVLTASLVVGFAFTLMELVWYRMLAPLLGGSTYTFGLILAVALLGIGLGGILYGLSARASTPSLTVLSATTALEAACLALPYALGDRIAVFAALSRLLGAAGFAGYVASWSAVAALVALPAAIVAGFQFPQLVSLLGRGRVRVGEDVGLAYAWNTLGAIAGSLAGGFGLLPILSAPGTWKGVVWLLAALSGWTLWLGIRGRAQKRLLPSLAALAAIAASLVLLTFTGPTAAWRHSPIGAGRVHLETYTARQIRAWAREQRRSVLWDADGRESSVALLRGRGGSSFAINGKVDGNSRDDAATQVMSGLVGAALHGSVKTALVVGLGTGSTAGWLGQLPAIERVDVAELESAVLRVARDCAPVNRDVLSNPKVHITIGDARELLLTTRRRYDLIFSEPSNPYRAGISSLFTQEFYEAVRSRLSPGGVFIQWLQAYEVDAQTVRTIYSTLGSVFPSVETYAGKNDDLLLVAREASTTYRVDALRATLAQEPFATAMQDAWRLTGLEGFLSHYIARDSLTQDIVKAEGGLVNTDDRNLVEFAFARTLGSGGLFQVEDLRWLAWQRDENRPRLEGPSPDWNVVHWSDLTRRTEEGLPTASPETDEEARRLAAHAAFLNGELPQVLASWEAGPWDPVGPLELAMIGEALADAGKKEALEFAERLRRYQPAEADAIVARWLWTQNRFKECFDATAASWRRYQQDPWPLSNVMLRLAAIASDLPAKDPSLAEPVYELLTPPLPVSLLEDDRLATRIMVAQHLGTAKVIEAMAPLEPDFPWRRDLLEDRVKVYEEAHHPRARIARQELDEFRDNEPLAIGTGLLKKAAAPPN